MTDQLAEQRVRRDFDPGIAVGGPNTLLPASRFRPIDGFNPAMPSIGVDGIDLNDVDAPLRGRIEPDFLLLQAGQGEERFDAA